jgi:hypothetical protein
MTMASNLHHEGNPMGVEASAVESLQLMCQSMRPTRSLVRRVLASMAEWTGQV